MNIELLRKVQQHIKEEPKRWSFAWGYRTPASPCGMKACIGGWTLILSGKNVYDTSAVARELLDISKEQADRLFFFWPPEFEEEHSAANAVARIDRFIETAGAE